MDTQDDFQFEGFEPANTTPVPDVLFDILLPHLNEAQLKVLLYIVRRTLGFKKTSDAISLNQFRWGITTKDEKKLDGGCGLKNFTTISKALQALEQMNCIEKVKGTTADGDPATTVYRIRFRGTTPTVVPTTPNGVPYYANCSAGTTPTVVRVLRQTESQETVLQQTEKQETVLQVNTLESNNNILTHPTFASYDATRLQEKKGASLKLQEATEPLTQESPITPPQENEMPKIEAQAQNKQVDNVSDSQRTTQKPTKQQVLIEKPKQPQMPLATMPWSAEKMVQITEARRYSRNKQGAYFSDEVPGNSKSKKTQRQKQIEVAKKIIGLGITEEQYIRAYDKRNDAWWNEKGSLTVEDMYAKTSKGNIRILEVLEGLDSKSTLNGNRSFSSVVPQQPSTPISATMTQDEANKLVRDIIAEAKEHDIVITAQVVSTKNDAWVVCAKWHDGSKDGLGLETIKVRAQWGRIFQQIRKMIQEDEKSTTRSVARMQEAK